VTKSQPPAAAPALARSRVDAVATLTFVGVGVLMLVMLGRVVQLQVAPGERLAAFMSDRLTTRGEPAVRGDVLDRRGRLIASTSFGQRVFIDPVKFPVPPGDAIIALAKALGEDPADVAKVIAPAIEHNQRAQTLPMPEDPDAPLSYEQTVKRYVPLTGILEDWRLSAVEGLRLDGKPIPGVHLETRSVRQNPGGELVAKIRGRVDVDHAGQAGAERLLDAKLRPSPGRFQYVRDAMGDPMWVFPGGYAPPQRGQDVRLSVDLEIQRIVDEELRRGIEDADAAGGRAIVLDPYSGEVLGMVDMLREVPGLKDYDWNQPIAKGGDGVRYRIIAPDEGAKFGPDMARNRCLVDLYEPGSTFKPFMWSAAVEAGVVSPDEWFSTYDGQWRTPYGRPISDVTKLPRQTWSDVLVNSSNIGMVQGVSRMSFQQARDAIREFGFGQRTNLGPPGESPGLVTSPRAWSKYTQTSVAMGYEIAVTPVQMARAFSAFCRTGELAGTIPAVRLTALDAVAGLDDPGVRVMPRKVADQTRAAMRGVTRNLDNRLATRTTGPQETFRFEAFGKSGTARAPLGLPPKDKRRPKGADGYFGGQYNVSFIAGAPADDPRIVVLVVVDDPGPELVRTRRYFGAMVAGPVNRRITERVLTYMGLQPTGESSLSAAPTGD
jgi:cell division protein FtsI (penicillin-binding protein 3)